MRFTTTTAILTTFAGFLVAPTGASAQTGCETVDYQGAPATICPEPVPDPTNCYTGDYQGVPIEICMPTGDTLPEGATIGGEPVVIHDSVSYSPPAVVAETTTSSTTVPRATAPVGDAVVMPEWAAEFQAALIANGGW